MSENIKKNQKAKREYWYFVTVSECVLCGYRNEYRERRYTPKPEKWQERTTFDQFACDEHFA